MDYTDVIQTGLDYIEDNLKADVSPAELADAAGFSLYHYYRLFAGATGLAVGQYILHRRLLHAVWEMACGRRGIDAALDYGFATWAGFYKAFRRTFGCTPALFIRAGRAKPPRRPDLHRRMYMTMTHKKAAAALRCWRLETLPLTEMYHPGSGHRYDNAYAAGADYVLYFCEDAAKAAARTGLIAALHTAGVGPALQKTPAGEAFIGQGDAWFYLVRRAPGAPLAAADYLGADGEARAAALGGAIARLHAALQTVPAPADPVDLYRMTADWTLPKAAGALGLTDDFCSGFLAGFAALYPALPRQRIHRDLTPGSAVMVGDAVWFIDPDASQENLRLFDICYAATAILSECFTDMDDLRFERWLTVYRSLLAGYDAAAPLTPAEKAAAPYVVLANQFLFIAWLGDTDAWPEILQTNLAMTRRLLAAFDALRPDAPTV